MEPNVNCLPEITQRYSPTSYSNKNIKKEKLDAIIEAARLAPSALNNQPWRYVFVHKKDESRVELENSLNITNTWAKDAPYLIVVFASKKDDTHINNIGYYVYDTALSVMSLILEAEHQELKTRQMAAFNTNKVKKALGIPEKYDVLVIIALGYETGTTGFFNKVSEKVKNKLIKQRSRKPREEIVFFGAYDVST